MRALLGTALVFLAPQTAFAATTLQAFMCTIGGLISQATPIVAGLALLAFFWGLAMYLFSLSGSGTMGHQMGYGMQAAATPQTKQMGRTIMLYGIVTLFVMLSIWGLVGILQQTFDLGSGGTITPPTINDVRPEGLSTPNCS